MEFIFLVIAVVGLIIAYFELVVPFVKGEVKFSKKFPFITSTKITVQEIKPRRKREVRDLKTAPSIAVLPFVNLSGDIENEYFSDGLTDDIITHLSKIEELKVISRTSVMHYKKTDKHLLDIGEELGVANILEGSVRKARDRVRIVAQLINAQTDEHLWAETYDRELSDIFAIQSDVAQGIAAALKAHVSKEEKKLIEKKPTENMEAYELYLQGRFFWNKRTLEDLQKAIRYFEQTIEKDPNYALAYAGIADSYNDLPSYSDFPPKEAYPKAMNAALKALEIDDTLAEAHTSLAHIKDDYHWDWEGAEREFKRALELNPAYVYARHCYAMHLLTLRRFDEAIEEMKRAHELDPLSLVTTRNLGWVFYHARQYDQAIETLQKTIEIDPNYSFTHYVLGLVHIQKSMYDEALLEFQKERKVSKAYNPMLESSLGVLYMHMGKRVEAEKILDDLIERSKKTYVCPFTIACLYFALEQDEQGFGWLDKAYEEHGYWMPLAKIFPTLDRIRSDPRYIALLKKMGLYDST